jgi:hypothetical protein
MCAVHMDSDGVIYNYIQIFVKIGTGVQTKLRFCLGNMNGYNVGDTDWK